MPRRQHLKKPASLPGLLKTVRHQVTAVSLALFCLTALAAPQQQGSSGEYKEEIDTEVFPQYRQGTLADSSHRMIAKQFDSLAERLDRFFGSSRQGQGSANSLVRIRVGQTWDEERDSESKIRIRAKVKLPRTKERLNLVFSGDSNEDLLEPRDVENPAITDNVETGLDLQYIEDEDDPRRDLSYKIGLRSEFKMRVGARFRYRFMQNEKVTFQFSEEPYWQDGRGFATRTRLDYDRALSDSRLVSLSNRFDFGEHTNGVNWDTLLSLGRTLDSKRAIAYYVGASGRTRPEYFTTQYEAGILYRRNVWRKWFFIELEPAYQWRRDPDTRERDNAALVTARFEVLFSQQQL